MTAQTTRWFEYGDPGAGDRVSVTIRTAYQTGPNESPRPDKVEFGTLPVDDLALLDKEAYSEHIHSDGSLLLSALSVEDEEELLSELERDEERQALADLIDAGCSPAEAVDYLVTYQTPVSQVEWADRRGISQQGVSDNVRRAGKTLD